jgi:hypothetical protein
MGPFSDGWTNTQVEAVLQHDDPKQVLYVPIVVGMNAPDCGREWAEEVCFRLASHPDWSIRANAMLGVAHIARTCRELNIEVASRVLICGLRDENAIVRSQAAEAVSDLQVFLGVRVSPE